MARKPLMVIPVGAPVQQAAFDLVTTIIEAVAAADEQLQDGDVLAVSSKYSAISQGRVITLDDIVVTPLAAQLAERYHLNPKMAQLVVQEADHIFGGIPGFLLTYKDGILSPNAGIDRSNIPNGYAVLFPHAPYQTAADLRRALRERLGVDVGIILTDSWLMPARLGTTGVALATAGFKPIQDERGKQDLFGNPMQVTQRGMADAICQSAQLVMGERDEATPLAIVRNTGVELADLELGVDDVAIDWRMCIYVQSLTAGLLVESLETVPSNGYKTEALR
ncbi:MAG TPA: coenzyme F420-0:L-glutamate ligase [Phototrophicaceae bacterium]|nr:coenzyme F420-0:L-glutamate ligase [Phototrophicaceae bacterium]